MLSALKHDNVHCHRHCHSARDMNESTKDAATERIVVLVSAKDKAAIRKQAEKAGVSVSRLLRDRALGTPTPSHVAELSQRMDAVEKAIKLKKGAQ